MYVAFLIKYIYMYSRKLVCCFENVAWNTQLVFKIRVFPYEKEYGHGVDVAG